MGDLAARVGCFVAEHVIPAEGVLLGGGSAARESMRALQHQARQDGLWALPVPVELGGQGLSLTEYAAQVAPAECRSDFGPPATGSDLLLDAMTLGRHAGTAVRERFLLPMVAGSAVPSYGMTEPDAAGSDLSGLSTTAVREGENWVLNGRKWFISRAADAAFTTVVCRTRPGADAATGLSLIVVPTDTAGYRVVRDLPVLGGAGQYEISLDDVRVPDGYLLGTEGAGLELIGERLGLGRVLRCLRWLGQADRAFELLLDRLRTRQVGGRALGDRQLLHAYVFDSHAEISAARAQVHGAVAALEAGVDARIPVGTAKVLTARAFDRVVDRAIQLHGAVGLTDGTPLPMLARTARSARILDGPDEIHVTTVARLLLRTPAPAAGFTTAPAPPSP